ncbi:MAG: tautomerase family protein [Burkholderiales bacterium]|nr:tautomerase family protein [Burkholderiales bacterium]
MALHAFRAFAYEHNPGRCSNAYRRPMPSAVVEVRREYTPEQECAILEMVHACIVQAFRVSPTHRNVTLTVHRPHRFLGRLDCPAPEYLTNISIYVLPGRSIDAKRRLFRLLVEGLAQFGVPAPCVLIRLHELPAANFGVRGGVPLSDVELGYPVDV